MISAEYICMGDCFLAVPSNIKLRLAADTQGDGHGAHTVIVIRCYSKGSDVVFVGGGGGCFRVNAVIIVDSRSLSHPLVTAAHEVERAAD